MPNGVGQPDWQDSLISPAALIGLSPFVGLGGCERFTATDYNEHFTTIALFSSLCKRLQLQIKIAFVSLSAAKMTMKNSPRMASACVSRGLVVPRVHFQGAAADERVQGW